MFLKEMLKNYRFFTIHSRVVQKKSDFLLIYLGFLYTVNVHWCDFSLGMHSGILIAVPQQRVPPGRPARNRTGLYPAAG
jgi:hypothetical protein